MSILMAMIVSLFSMMIKIIGQSYDACICIIFLFLSLSLFRISIKFRSMVEKEKFETKNSLKLMCRERVDRFR